MQESPFLSRRLASESYSPHHSVGTPETHRVWFVDQNPYRLQLLRSGTTHRDWTHDGPISVPPRYAVLGKYVERTMFTDDHRTPLNLNFRTKSRGSPCKVHESSREHETPTEDLSYLRLAEVGRVFQGSVRDSVLTGTTTSTVLPLRVRVKPVVPVVQSLPIGPCPRVPAHGSTSFQKSLGGTSLRERVTVEDGGSG